MSRTRSAASLGLLMALLATSPALHADESAGTDWNQWRGPNGDGVSQETGWSTDWPSEGPQVLWSVELGAPANNRDGSSTVAVVRDRVYVLGTGFAYCLDADTGKEVWKIPFPASHSTPAVRDGRVYLYGTQGEFFCVAAATGKTIWSKDMRKDFGADRAGAYGYAGSPMLIGDLVLISARVEGGALFAFDQKTGDVKWKAFHAGHKGYALWSSPVLATIEGKPTVVWLSGPTLAGIDPANGKTLWKHDIPPENGKVGCAAANPVVVGNRVVAQYHPPHARGYTFCLEIKGGKAHLAWQSRDLANWFFSCVGYDGCLYGVDQSPRGRPRDMGALQCYDVATGKLLWSVNGFGQSGQRPVRRTRQLVPTGTFMIADGKMISWARELVVAEVSAKGHKVLSVAKIPSGGYRTMPVLCVGRIYLRARDGRLVCLNVRKD